MGPKDWKWLNDKTPDLDPQSDDSEVIGTKSEKMMAAMTATMARAYGAVLDIAPPLVRGIRLAERVSPESTEEHG